MTLVPALDANAASNGVMKRTAFDYIESTILQTVQEHLSELDGIYLHLHGASEVEGIGSGDHHILKEVRRIVGPYMPIAVVCDPHGNLCKEYVEGTTLIRSYRESPTLMWSRPSALSAPTCWSCWSTAAASLLCTANCR